MFKPELKIIKWTDADLDTFNKIERIAGIDLKQLGNRLHHVKKDVNKNLGLGCFKLLVKDFKIYKFVEPSDLVPQGVFVGCATLPVSLKATFDYFTVDSVASEMIGLMRERNF